LLHLRLAARGVRGGNAFFQVGEVFLSAGAGAALVVLLEHISMNTCEVDPEGRWGKKNSTRIRSFFFSSLAFPPVPVLPVPCSSEKSASLTLSAML
jgi:hypothetical protein